MNELKRKLLELVESMPGDKYSAIYLFGIRNADALGELESWELKELGEAVGSPAYATEFRKAMKLSKHL